MSEHDFTTTHDPGLPADYRSFEGYAALSTMARVFAVGKFYMPDQPYPNAGYIFRIARLIALVSDPDYKPTGAYIRVGHWRYRDMMRKRWQ